MQQILPAAVILLFPVERRVLKLTEEFIRELKQRYTKGVRILLESMGDDPRPIEPGTKGTVLLTDDIGTVHCLFDNGRQLGLIPGTDRFSITEERKGE